MPELAEVEFYRRRWWETGAGQRVREAQAEARSRVFRKLAEEFRGGAPVLAKTLKGARLSASAAHGKQMWFVFTPEKTARGKGAGARSHEAIWVGIHLGMSGELRVEPTDYRVVRHDALVLRMERHALVFNDPRQFGRVRAWTGAKGEKPPWLRELAPVVTGPEFTVERVRDGLKRHSRAPLKAVLLNQEYFPGIGNWMADEILWRAALPPALAAGRAASLRIAKKLHAVIREVANDALRVIAGWGKKLPPDLNVHIPDTWLFNHRWEDGGRCPRTGKPLRREEIGGRTTCWSPAWQRLRR
ncbi:MAG: DNA-formamidopyrimidine glycosylase family protein [Opitutales bacterium]|jgi:formamidopyrimidine-DNA glycosylase